MMSMTSAATEILARDADGPEFGKASPLGLLLVLLLLIGTIFLIRSMNKHLRKLPTSFMRGESESDQAADESTGDAGLADDPAPTNPAPTSSDETRRRPTE